MKGSVSAGLRRGVEAGIEAACLLYPLFRVGFGLPGAVRNGRPSRSGGSSLC